MNPTAGPKAMEDLFSALADRTRLRLLNLMRDGEVCVCFFTEVLGQSQPKISRHLAYLRRAGLVNARRDGKWMHYSIAFPEDSAARRVLEEIFEWMDSSERLREEAEIFRRMYHSPELRETIARTPMAFIGSQPIVAAPQPVFASAHNELEEFLL